jgi:hypothetical protein
VSGLLVHRFLAGNPPAHLYRGTDTDVRYEIAGRKSNSQLAFIPQSGLDAIALAIQGAQTIAV